MAGIADRRDAELALKDVVRQLRDVLARDFARVHAAELRLNEAPQMAGDVFPALDPGPHLAVLLPFRRAHPVYAFLDHLCDRDAVLGLLLLLLAQLPDQRRRVHSLRRVDLAAGIFDPEGLGVVDAEPSGALLAGRRVGELEREGCDAGRGNADVEARTFAVVDLDPLGDPLLAHAVGEDDAAVAGARGNGFGGCG